MSSYLPEHLRGASAVPEPQWPPARCRNSFQDSSLQDRLHTMTRSPQLEWGLPRGTVFVGPLTQSS
jgi:hypothetical protein